MTALPTYPRLAKKARLRWDGVEKKPMLLYPERGLILNETGASILAMCDGKHSIPMMIASFTGEAGVLKIDIEKEVVSFLHTIQARGLFEPPP